MLIFVKLLKNFLYIYIKKWYFLKFYTIYYKILEKSIIVLIFYIKKPQILIGQRERPVFVVKLAIADCRRNLT